MNKTVAAVCAVLVIAFNSEKCFCSKISVDKIDVQSDVNDDNGPSKRVARQAYQAQTQLYPNLPTGPPYGLAPYPNNNNQNTRPGYNDPSGPYGQEPQPNAWQPNGQPNFSNPYGTNNYTQPGNPNGYKPSNFTNNPSGHYGQYPQQPPNPWQPNGQQPNYNNPYGTNSQLGNNNYTQPGYPISNGYKPSNFSYNPSGPYGQSTPYSLPNPYSSGNGQSPYSSNASNPYPGYKPPNTYNPSGRPPYHQPGQSHNNSYSGYPSYTTTPYPYPGYPSQRPPYYPGQSQTNNNTRPGSQHSVIYDDSTKRPGPNPYNSYNASNWSGNTLNNTYGRPSYNPQNGQSPQYFNSYPGSPGYGQQNSTNPYNMQNQRPPYQDPHSGQHSPNGYPGHSSDSATFNLANSGYNPSIPDRPPYGSSYGNGPYGNTSPNHFQYSNATSYDPTRVSPQHFNSN